MAKQFLIIILFFVQLISFGQDKNTTDLREITHIEVYKDGMLYWTTVKEHNTVPYVIEQFRWNKWVKIGEVDAVGRPGENKYSFHPIPYNGENKFRVKPFKGSDSTSFKEIKWNASMPEVKFTVHRKNNEIVFSTETMFEIHSSSGELIKRGYALTVPIESLPNGKYILNYDNLTAEFKK